MDREIKKQRIFKHVLDRTKGLVRLDDLDLEAILDISEDDSNYVEVKFYEANWINNSEKVSWRKIRTFKVQEAEVEKTLASISHHQTIGHYMYELPNKSIISNDVMLFQTPIKP